MHAIATTPQRPSVLRRSVRTAATPHDFSAIAKAIDERRKAIEAGRKAHLKDMMRAIDKIAREEIEFVKKIPSEVRGPAAPTPAKPAAVPVDNEIEFVEGDGGSE